MKTDRCVYAEDNPLGYAPVMRLIGKFAIPSAIGMLVNAAYNVTDQIFIGHAVGMLGNAAIHVTFPVMMFAATSAQLVGVGTASNFNLSLGAKNKERAKGFVGTGLMLMLVLGLIILMAVQAFSTPILEL